MKSLPLEIAWNLDEQIEGSICTTGAVVVVVVAVVVRSGMLLDLLGGPANKLL